MPRITIDSFTPGIKAASGYTNLKNASASDIVNFDIDDYGRLTPRKGCEHVNSTVLNSAPQKMARVYAGIVKHLIVSIDDAQGLWYLDSGNFSELKNSSDSTPSSINLNYSDETLAKFGHAVMSSRLFLGWSVDTSTPADGSQDAHWVDITASTPVLYNHGISDAPPSAPTLDTSEGGGDGKGSGGVLDEDATYQYKVSFYRSGEEIESLPSSALSVTLATGENEIWLSNIDTSADQQVNQRKLYRTEGGGSTFYLLGTISDNTTTTYHDTLGDGGLGSEIDCGTHDNPPNYRYVKNHNGRLWVADDDDENLYLSYMDDLGSPYLDVFPVTNVGSGLVPYKIAVGHEDGDIIHGLAVSPLGQQLVVFKRNSTTILYGNEPDNIDISNVIDTTGTVAPFSIANVGGLLFFLTANKQIWIFDGQSIKPISRDINPLLENIPEGRFMQCTGINYYEKYLLCYPSGDNANDRILVYDADQSYWITYDLPMNDLSWWTGNESSINQDRLVGARSDSGYVDYLFEDSLGNDITQDNSSDITCVWQSNWIEFPSTATVTGVYVYPASSSSATFSARVDTDHTNGTAKTFTPSASNLYRQGFFKRGRLHRVRISVTDSQDTIPDIEKFEVEYQLK